VSSENEAHQSLETKPLGKENRAAFSCGDKALDDYLKTQASQDVKKRVAAVFILENAEGGIAGYYALSSTAVLLKDLPEDISQKLPKYPLVPATLLGRLAVDSRHRGQGLGEFLLMDALRKALENSCEIGSAAVIVDAKNSHAKRFYQKYDFIELPDQPFRLFLPMRTIERLFR
jgi:GNAT superfamily N-acetyltransferase